MLTGEWMKLKSNRNNSKSHYRMKWLNPTLKKPSDSLNKISLANKNQLSPSQVVTLALFPEKKQGKEKKFSEL